ncbi:MAG: hypothetical protein MHPSP_002486 [Paramarteilia canceri]
MHTLFLLFTLVDRRMLIRARISGSKTRIKTELLLKKIFYVMSNRSVALLRIFHHELIWNFSVALPARRFPVKNNGLHF